MSKLLNRFYLLWLAAGLCVGFTACTKDNVPQEPPIITYTALTQKLVDSSGLISTVFADTTFEVFPGVEETDIHYLGTHGLTTRAFILKVDLKKANLALRPLMPYGATSFGRQTVPDMIKWVDGPHSRVLAAFNSDFFDDNGIPRSAVVIDGQAVKTEIQDTWSFFGVTQAGELVIGSQEDFPQYQTELLHALGGRHRVVRDGRVVPQSDERLEPRTAVGFSADQVVYFVVVDGRKFDYANGMAIEDLGHLLKALGAKEGLNLDGGGSSTFVIRHPLADVWQVRNRTSDGAPRAVANGWAIVADIP